MKLINPTRYAVGGMTTWRITILNDLKQSNLIITVLPGCIPRIQPTEEKKNRLKLFLSNHTVDMLCINRG